MSVAHINESKGFGRPVKEKLIRTICQSIVESLHPVRIILFGSHATGMATDESDVDFLVVTETPLKKKVVTAQISTLLPEELCKTAMDIIAVSKEEYEETKDIIGGVTYPASKYGRVMYENP